MHTLRWQTARTRAVEVTVRLAKRLDALQQRHPRAGFPIAVVYKFVDDQGVFLAALITYYGFLSLFPLLLLVASVLGFLLQSEPDLQETLLDTAVRQFPVIGADVANPEGLQGSGAAVLVGAVIAVYGASRVSHATQHAMNVCWAVPRHKRPNPIVARLRSAVLIGIAAVALLGSTVLSALSNSAESYGLAVGGLTSGALLALSFVMVCALFALGMKTSTAQSLTWSQVLPGAATAALGWQVMQTFGATYVGQVVNSTNDTYGVFALVLGLMAWLFIIACILVLSVEINVVAVKNLYPRGLLAPFTENTELTDADEQSFTDTATATKTKEFEEVEVTFNDEGEDEDEDEDADDDAEMREEPGRG
ncbi:MAG: YihY/virulence factor BrkB family protein [Ornithinimicrobium sp.]